MTSTLDSETAGPASAPPASPPADASPSLAEVIDRLRQPVTAGLTRPESWRQAKLKALLSFVEDREADLLAAADSDLGRHPFATWLLDANMASGEIRHAMKKVGKWMKPTRIAVPITLQPGQARSVPEPKGVALILAPWNYPIQLSLAPVAAALAAGNTVVLKPSELSPATSDVLADLPHYLGADTVEVVLGGPEAANALLAERFDHIFFTGSTRVGKIVMEAAAKYVTPVTLELGGKSPTIVTASADIAKAAKRIAWAKTINAGQTCIAPDYVLVEESVKDELMAALAEQLPAMFQADGSPTKIISERHAERLQGLLSDHGGNELLAGGKGEGRSFEPVLVADPETDSPLMTEEIFGPILPVLSVPNLDAAIDYINADEKPLALYLFTKNRDDEVQVVNRTSSGGLVVNHLLQHLAVPELPFGGVGESGMGAYHGQAGFEEFSHRKSVLRKPAKFDPPMLFPPYADFSQKVLRKLMR